MTKTQLDIWNKETGPDLHPVNPEDIRKSIRTQNNITVILDDDPTGSQTTHDIPVICEIDREIILNIIKEGYKAFFLLTNTRSLNAKNTEIVITKIGNLFNDLRNTLAVNFSFISRGDSTLRSHFPLEVSSIKKTLYPKLKTTCLIIPAFFEGGRFTHEDTHYVLSEDRLIPASKTEFSKDLDFGYSTSYLPDWVKEKTKDQNAKVSVLPLTTLRKKTPKEIAVLINNEKEYLIINALNYADLNKISKAAHFCSSQGSTLLFQTAASFVKAYLGQENFPLLDKIKLGVKPKNRGLIIVGSHVNKTTQQLNYLINNASIQLIYLDNERLINWEIKYIEKIINKINYALRTNKSCVISTGRETTIIKGWDNYKTGQLISNHLCKIINQLPANYDFIISKGGITSHNIATKALKIKVATVIGQIIPGVPVWNLSKKNERPKPYIIFPGNVGNEKSLFNAFKKLTHV